MKYCFNCGAPLESNALFCKKCGAKLVQYGLQKHDEKDNTNKKTAGKGYRKAKSVKRKPNLYIIVVPSVMFVIAIISFIWVYKYTKSKTIELDQYFNVTFIGSDGSGCVKVDMKPDLIDVVLQMNHLNYTSDEIDEDSSVIKTEDLLKVSKIYRGIRQIDYDCDKTEELSNGDVVRLFITFGDDTPNLLGVHIKECVKEITVNGLSNVES